MGKVEALTTEPAVVAYKQRHQTTTKLKLLTGEVKIIYQLITK